MIQWLAIILINLFFCLCKSSSLIRIEIDIKWDCNKITVYAGNPANRFYLPIELNSKFSWFLEKEGSPYYSHTIKNEELNREIHYKNSTFVGRKIDDSIYFKGQEASKAVNLVFYVITKYYWYWKGNIGAFALPFKFVNDKYSIVHQYKKHNLIDSLSFSIVRNSLTVDYLYLGGIPMDHIKNLTHSYCDVIGNNGHWECLFNGAKFSHRMTNASDFYSSSSIKKNNYAHFDLIEPYIYVPNDFFDFLIDKIFNKYIEDDLSGVGSFKGKRQIICYSYYETGNITFFIGVYSYTYQISKFVQTYDEYCEINIIENPYGNYWIFGTRFIDDFNIHFDYDNRKINFYSDKNVKYNPVNQKEKIDADKRDIEVEIRNWSKIILLMSNVVLLSIGLVLLCLLRSIFIIGILMF